MKPDAPRETSARAGGGVTGSGTQTHAPSLQHSNLPPAIPDHEMLRCIGQGSYGEVWLARNVMGEPRAVKVVRRATFGDNRPFEREFEGIKKFEPISRSHESQVQILHVGLNAVEGYFYYVMELADDANAECGTRSADSAGDAPAAIPHSYVPRTLRHDLELYGRLSLAQCIDIGLSLTTALVHLHNQGLVHRDIKPSNIIFVNGRPKLADIGLVTDVGDAKSIVGTEGYLAPEGPGSPQADLYSLGKVLYEISTGRDRRHFPDLPLDLIPGSARDDAGLGSTGDWPAPSGDSPGGTGESPALPDRKGLLELNEILLKACARDSRQRYQSAEEMHADLELLQRGLSVRRKRTWEQGWLWCKKAGMALSVLGVIAASALILLRQPGGSNSYPDGPPSTNMDANAISRGALNSVRNDEYDKFAQDYTNFHRAIEMDPHFVEPYVGLLELLCRETVPGLKTEPEELRAVALKLQELDPDSHLAPTCYAQAMLAYWDWDLSRSEEACLRTIKTNPDYELGHTGYGLGLCQYGRPVEARAELEIARKLAPSKSTVYRMMGHTYYVERRYTNAIFWYRKALERERHHEFAYLGMGLAQRAMGDYTNAMENLAKAEVLSGADEPKTRKRYAELQRAFEQRGALGYWEQRWRELETAPGKRFYEKAVIQIKLGNTNTALGFLRRSYETRESSGPARVWPLQDILIDEYWDGLHDDPQFKELLDKIGFTKVMRPGKR